MKLSITRQARAIYRGAFNGETMPNGWHVFFVDHCGSGGDRWRGSLGVCWYDMKRIEVRRPGKHPDWLRTLIHEFIHLRCHHDAFGCRRGLRHGREFDRLIATALARLWAS
jgi:hypothetical protein